MAFVKYNQNHQTLSERGMCPGCDDGHDALRADAKYPGNFEKAWKLKARIKRYVRGHPGCSMDDIYRDLRCEDIAMYIAVHWLVENFELKGADPYACGSGTTHTEKHYRIHVLDSANQMELLATT